MSADDVLVRAREALDGITTPTPWSMHHGSVYGASGPKSTYYGRDGHPSVATAEGGYVEGEFTDGDGEFIAAAPQLVADLIREIDDLRTMLDTDNLVDVVERCQAEADVALARAAESETLGRKLRDSATDHFRARLDAEAERDRLRDIIARVRKVANAWPKPDYTSNETEGFGKKIIRALGDEAQG